MEIVKVDKKMKFDISLSPSELTQDHPQFTRVKVKVLYTKFNRNNSYITDDAVKKALPTIYNIPLVGEYLEEKDNFGSHGGKLEITDEEVKFIQTTIPYGVVPLDAKLSWETVTEEDGTIRDYLVADGALLWTSRYPELDTILEEGKFGQSMEIEVNEGGFAIIDGQETFKIDDFVFSALCILGVDKGDYNEHVEPCFESASISTYGIQDETFKQKFNFMLEEFNSSISSKEESGGKKVTKEKQELNFELTHQQLSAKLRQNLETHRFVDKDGESARRYWYQDHTNTKVIYEDLAEAGQLYESPYTVNGNEVTVDLSDKVESSLAFIPDNSRKRDDYSLTEELEKAEAKIAEFEATLTAKDEEVVETVESLKAKHAEDFEALKVEYSETVKTMKDNLATLAEKSSEFEAIQTEVKELREFKRTTELAEVKAKFSGKLEEKSLDAILEASENKSVDELEVEIFAEIGKKNFSLTQEVTVKHPEIHFSQKQEVPTGAHAALIAKHK